MEVVTIVRHIRTRGDVLEFQSELSTVCDSACVNIRPGKLVVVEEGSYHARLEVWHSGLGLVLVAFGDEGASFGIGISPSRIWRRGCVGGRSVGQHVQILT